MGLAYDSNKLAGELKCYGIVILLCTVHAYAVARAILVYFTHFLNFVRQPISSIRSLLYLDKPIVNLFFQFVNLSCRGSTDTFTGTAAFIHNLYENLQSQ